MWVKDHAKNNKMSTFSQQTNGLILMVKDLEMMIATQISTNPLRTLSDSSLVH
jgi:hypothetical protein